MSASIDRKNPPITRRLLLTCALLVLSAALAGHSDEPSPRNVPFLAKCDGSTQHYVLLLPEDFKQAQPHNLLIALHGHGALRHPDRIGGGKPTKAPRDP